MASPQASSGNQSSNRFVNKAARDKYVKFSTLGCYPEKYIDLSQLIFYDIGTLLQDVELRREWSYKSRVKYYPDQVREFYANLSCVPDDDGSPSLLTRVSGVRIHLASGELRHILHISDSCKVDVSHVFMLDPHVLKKLGPHWNASGMSAALLPTNPRILQKVILHNLIPREGSHNYVTKNDAQCLYCIMGNIKVNWALIIIEAMLRPVTTILYFPCTITKIIRYFNIPLDESCSRTVDSVLDDVAIRQFFRLGLNQEEVHPDSDEGEEDKQTPHSVIPKKRKVCATRRNPRKTTESTASDIQSMRTQIVDLTTAVTNLTTRMEEGFEGMQTHFSSSDENDRATSLILAEIQETQAIILSKIQNWCPYASTSNPRPPR